MNLFCKGKAFLSAAIKPRNIKFIFWVTWLICFVIWFHVQLPFFAHFKNCVITIHHHVISETEVEIFIRVYCELLTSLWKSSVSGGLVLLESPLVHHFSSLLESPCGCLFTTAISWVEVALPKAYGACSPVVGLQWQYKRCWNCPSVETCLQRTWQWGSMSREQNRKVIFSLTGISVVFILVSLENEISVIPRLYVFGH